MDVSHINVMFVTELKVSAEITDLCFYLFLRDKSAWSVT